MPHQSATIEVSSTEKLPCIIYLPKDFDQYGFKGPECNVPYTYQPGTYIVGISHPPIFSRKITYTIQWK